MELIADRFVRDEEERAWDLATGSRVWLVLSTAGGPSEQAAWAERCAWLSRVSHAGLAPLVDYGVIGTSTRFEAWGAVLPWAGAGSSAAPVVRSVERFLAASGRVAFEQEPPIVGALMDRAVVIPGAAAGRLHAHQVADVSAGGGLDACGILLMPDRRLAPLLELLESQQSGGPAALGVWIPTPWDGPHVVSQLARAARIGGRVPVDVRVLRHARLQELQGRTLMVLAGADAESGWRRLLQASMAGSRPHIACFCGERVVPRVHTIGTTKPDAAALVASVIPASIASRHRRRIATAARRARGSAGRFAQVLFGGHERHVSVAERRRVPREAGRAAEEAAVQVLGSPQETRCPSVNDARRRWPAPGEVMRLRSQAAQVSALLSAGRYDPGERLARQVMHALARRSEWADAVGVSLHLARALRRRGLSVRALGVVDLAREWEADAGSLDTTLSLAILRADLLVDQGGLAAASAILELALAAAVSADHPSKTACVVALARCLHWQGRDADAWQRLSLADAADDTGSSASTVRRWICQSAVATGCGRVADAVALAARARDQAAALGDEAVMAEALTRCAEVQLAVGDPAQASSVVGQALPYARRAHAPVLALELRLIRAEAARRVGQRGAAARCVSRCRRLASRELPALLRARVSLLEDLLDAADPSAVAAARAESTGLAALRHFAPAPVPSCSATVTTADDLVALLQCCQVAQDDRAVLVAVCSRLRVGLGAAGVGFLLAESGQVALVSSDGQRPDGSIAARVLAAQQLVLPDAGGGRPEAGVPVRVSGETVGVLAAVWTTGARWQAGDVAMLLSTGATAAAPALATLRSQRAADRRGRTSEWLGAGAAAADIRTAIERAASAPFPVLIDGESGVGKELVARLLHKLGPRRERPLATMNCAALPDELAESELFGHARGAFTGAAVERRGLFEDAHGGCLFLDEVGELSLRAQAKLLRAIQEGEVRRLGENTSRRVDVRLIAATNRVLHDEVAAGRFRLDLLYRLDVLRITIPPLRARREDIPILAEHIWRDAAGRVGSRAMLAPATLEALARHDWPGNVRELQNVLAALAVRVGKRGLVVPASLPPGLAVAVSPVPQRLDDARDSFDRAFITSALVRTGGRRTRAARELGVSRQGLAKLMARLAIAEPHVENGCIT